MHLPHATGVAPAFVVSSSCSQAAHPRSTRRWLAAHRNCKPFISFSAPCRMHFHFIHFLQPHPTASRRRFYLSIILTINPNNTGVQKIKLIKDTSTLIFCSFFRLYFTIFFAIITKKSLVISEE